MQLRYLQTLSEIGAEQNSTVVFPMPIDIIKPFLDLMEQPASTHTPVAKTDGKGIAQSVNTSEVAV